MSFLSVLKNIGRAVQTFAPIAQDFVPGGNVVSNLLKNAPSLIQHIQGSIVSSEVTFLDSKSGQLKHDDVVNSFNNYIGTMRDIAQAQGKDVTYDAAALDAFISAQVAAYNAGATLIASIKIT